MGTQQNIENRLWDYIDGACSEEEKTFIEQLLATSQEWRQKYKELLEVHQLMSNSLELDEPSLRFTQNVMEEIGKYYIAPAAKTYLNKRIIRGIGIFFLLSIVGFLIYAFGIINWADTNTSGLSIDFNKVDMSKLNLNKFFSNTYTNIFLMVNVVLGLMLLDMYLGKKKKQLRGQA